ncbi:hypothetical protein TNCV_445231 [Trichonephila clavipes]|nr:hypothetical protein TNCV_445231 [Trichonephila clavipes]
MGKAAAHAHTITEDGRGCKGGSLGRPIAKERLPGAAEQVNRRKIVRVQYFVRGGFVGYRSRASSKASLPSSSGRRARFLGGQKGVALHLQAARVGVGSTKKPTRC